MKNCRSQSRRARIWSNKVLREIAPLFSGDIINVSGWKDEDKEGHTYREYFTSAHSYCISNCKGSRGIEDNPLTDFLIDLTAPALLSDLDRRFDVVFNHTTLEHIFDVRTAFRNLCQMSRDVVIVVVPFAQRLHYEESYGDYWRFTPMSLKSLFAENRFEIVFEAASPYEYTSQYLLVVGSRQPDYWQGRMPPWKPVERLGDWIGRAKWSTRLRYKVGELLAKFITRGHRCLRSFLISINRR